jgi:hypothetical protein
MKFKYHSLLVLFFLMFVCKRNSHAQTIVNADFEQWNGNCPYNTIPTGWTNFSTSLGPDKAGNCTGSVAPFSGDAHMNLVWYSSTGLIEGATQTISGFTIGTTYDLAFKAINDQGLYSFGAPVFCEVYVNGNVIFTTPELFDGGAWTAYTASFVATNDTMTIGFKVKNGLSGTSGSLGIDAVSFLNLTGNKSNVSNNEIKVFPNPTNDWLHINTNNELENVKLFNSLFEEVYLGSVRLNEELIKLDLSTLPIGVYTLQITIDGQIQYKKVIKL